MEWKILGETHEQTKKYLKKRHPHMFKPIMAPKGWAAMHPNERTALIEHVGVKWYSMSRRAQSAKSVWWNKKHGR